MNHLELSLIKKYQISTARLVYFQIFTMIILYGILTLVNKRKVVWLSNLQRVLNKQQWAEGLWAWLHLSTSTLQGDSTGHPIFLVFVASSIRIDIILLYKMSRTSHFKTTTKKVLWFQISLLRK